MRPGPPLHRLHFMHPACTPRRLVNVLGSDQWSEDVVPTVAFNLRQIRKGNVIMKVWDVAVGVAVCVLAFAAACLPVGGCAGGEIWGGAPAHLVHGPAAIRVIIERLWLGWGLG